MGTTAQKLEYLGTTKSQLKDMINYGLDDDNKITSSTTFRNYVSSIFNAFLEALRTPDTLFTNLPKKSGTGANITLNDTANAPMRIELGASELSQDGTPTPSTPQDIHTISGSNKVVVNGKNLFDESTMEAGKNIDSSGVWESYNQSGASEVYIPVIPSTQYTYNCSSAYTLRVNKYTSNKIHIERIQKSSATDFTFTTDANCYFIRISFYVGTTVTQELVNSLHFWIEKTNQATTYEPYISQEAEVDLGDLEYCKIGTYSDRIFKNVSGDTDYSSERDDGAWYIKKNIGKVVLDGSESWYNEGGGAPYTLNITGSLLNTSNSSLPNLFTNYYQRVSYNSTWTNYNSLVSTGPTTSPNKIKFRNTDITSLSDWTNWLSNNNTTLYYVLETPTYTKITGTLETQLENAYYNLTAYDNQTNISQTNNDLPFVISASTPKTLVNM